MKDKDQQWAIFWCSLLQPALFDQIETGQVNQFLKDLSQKEVTFPDGRTKNPSLSTLRRKLNVYKNEGFTALARKRRSDLGKPRAHSPEVIDKAVDIKRDGPGRSHVTINNILQMKLRTKVPKSTLYRHLRRAGATKIKLGVDKQKVRRRWSRDKSSALWVGDFEDGPYVLHQGEVVPTHLSAFIDCHSRLLIEGRYYLHENLDILIDSFLRGLHTHGSPLELYVDQAKIYQSRALKSACLHLNIRHIHRGAGDPPPGGLIEKFFDTTQSQFEEEVRQGAMLTFEKLNRGFSAWLEMSYHRTPNTETNETPIERYEKGLTIKRHVDLEAVLVYFMRREKRTVHPDFSDVQLNKRLYRVDKRLRTDRVEVRFDPYSSMDTVLIYSLEGEYLGKGVEHKREKGEDPSPPPKRRTLKYDYINMLIERHDEELQEKTQGIDYRRAVSQRRWSFTSFAKALAKLMGLKGEMTALTGRELDLLKRYYNRCPRLTRPLLLEAFEKADDKSLLEVLYQLQNLYDRKEQP